MEPPHDHHWHVTAGFRSHTLDTVMGVVVDFLAVDDAMNRLCSQLDGGDFNALPAFVDGKASAEHIAEFLATLLSDALADLLGPPEGAMPWLAFVRVTEAPGCAATFIVD